MKFPVFVTAVLVAWAITPQSQAQNTYTWTGAQSTAWNTTDANWTGFGTVWANSIGPLDIAQFASTATVTVAAGINVGQIDFTGAGTYSLSGSSLLFPTGGTITAVAGATATINSAITTLGALNLSGAGTIIFSSATSNTVAGAINLSGGIAARFTTTAAFPITTYNVNASTIGLDFDGVSILSTRTFAITSTGTFDTASISGNTINGLISGSGTFVKTGPGLLTVTNTAVNTITGGFTVSGGTLRFGGTNGMAGTTNVYTLNGGTLSFGFSGTSFGSGRTFVLNATAGNQIEVTGGTTPITITGVMSGGGGFAKTGAGILAITGTANTYAGTTTLNAGTLRLSGEGATAGAAGQLGLIPATATPGSLVLNGGTLESTTGTSFTVAANRGVLIGTAAPVTINVTGSGTMTIGGVVAGSAGFTKTGAGRFSLAVNNTFSGSVVVAGGTLIGSFAGSLGTGVDLSIINGATYDVSTTLSAGTTIINSTTLTNGVIASTNLLSNASALRSANWSLVNGLVATPLGGTGGVNKNGLGTVTFLANNFNFTFGTTPPLNVNGGAVYYPQGSATVLGQTTNSITINGGAFVFGPVAIGAFNSGRSLNLGASTTNIFDGGTGGANTIQGNVTGVSGDGGFHKTGTGTFAFNNTATVGSLVNAYSGPTTLWAGEFRAPLGDKGLPATTALILRGGVFTANGTSGAVSLTRALGTSAEQLAWAPNSDGGFAAFVTFSTTTGLPVAGSGPTTVNVGNNSTPDTLTWGVTSNFIQSGRVLILGSALANSSLTLSNPIDLAGATRVVSVPLGTGTDLAVLGGGLTDSVGGAGLIKTGGSMLSVAGAPGYAGSTTIAAGSLQFDSSTLPAGNIVLAGGVLQLTSASPQTFTASLGTGAGQIQFAAGGGFAANTSALTVNLGGAAAPLVWGSTPSFVPSGSPLSFGSSTGTAAVTLSNPLDLNLGARTIAVNGGTTTLQLTNGSLTKTGTGTLALAPGSTLDAAGTLTVSAGTLDLGSEAVTVAGLEVTGSLLGTAGITVGGNVLLRDTSTLSVPLTTSGTVTRSGGANSTIISAAMPYTGPTVVNGNGRLLISGTAPFGSILSTSSITINGGFPTAVAGTPIVPTLGGTLTVSLTDGQDRVATPASGNGTLPVTINGGSLVVSGTGAAGVTTISQNYGALTLGAGGAQIYLAPNPSVAGQTITLAFNPASGNGLTTSAGSTLLVAGAALGTTTRVFFEGTLPSTGTGSASGTLPSGGTPGPTTVGVLRGVFADTAAVVTTGSTNQFNFAAAGRDIATYDPATGVRPLAAAEYQQVTTATTGFAPTSGANVKITGATATFAAGATNTINSLVLSSGTAAATAAVLNPASTAATVLNITSGNILFTDGNNNVPTTPAIGTGIASGSFTLNIPGGTAVSIHVGNGTSATTTSPALLSASIRAAIVTNAGLVKSGPGILSWSTSNGTSTVTGGIFFNGGVVSVGSISGTIGSTQPLVFNGGAFEYTATAATPPSIVNTNANPITLNAAGGTISVSQGGGALGGGTFSPTNQLPNSAILITGSITGAGALTKVGTGGIIVQATNSYAGGTTLGGALPGTPTAGGVLGIVTVGTDNATLLSNQLGTGPLTLITGTLMAVGTTNVAGGNSLALANAVNLSGENSIAYIAPTTASNGFVPSAVTASTPARITLSGPITITNGFGHTLTNNNPANVGGYSLVLAGTIGENLGNTNLTFQGIGTSVAPGSNPLFTPALAAPTSLTNISITGANTYTGQTTIRQGIVNPSASVLAGQNGPLGNSYLPVVLGDPGGGTFAGLLLAGNNLTVSRNIQLQIAGQGTAPASAVAPVYLGTVTGNTGGTFSGNIQLANRNLVLFSGGGTLASPTVYSGVISDAGTVTAGNAGTFATTVSALTGANIYSGGTAVANGTLLVNNTSGSGTGTGSVSVSAGATLGGMGTIAGTVANAGTVSPGTTLAARTLTVGGANFAPNSTLATTLFGYGATEIGLLNAGSGTVTVDPTAGIRLDLGAIDADTLRTAVGSSTRTYTVATSTGSVANFTPANLTFTGLGNFLPSEWSIVSAPSPGTVQLNFTPIPEPATALLAGVGALALATRWKRRKRAAA
jgi:autotransporter-associated beta strand protein